MRQIFACASTSQVPARPKCGRRKHKTLFVPLRPKSGSFSSFSGIREELQFSGIFPENPVGLASMGSVEVHGEKNNVSSGPSEEIAGLKKKKMMKIMTPG